MNELFIIGGAVIFTEGGLIWTFLKVGRLMLRLILSMEKIHADFMEAKGELAIIKKELTDIRTSFEKLQDGSILQVKGVTSWGKVDLEVNLDKSQVEIVK
jgi:hypothetical protein